ncbi:transmembrane gamma-carboxyglutamic acid protein 2 [Erpetoichthys calabaricus]|uniref:Transmembrane gamma-carboxyglutamic acid protein 2-like n=1 Tax=Erpetoichthys calabaricus TaxID=27687 RepID=A0A8C4SDA5_ERPCA|nr:transmembrane gamma-carboxyglutamic acid protein 2 [Erpetoichthys calabaricus]
MAMTESGILLMIFTSFLLPVCHPSQSDDLTLDNVFIDQEAAQSFFSRSLLYNKWDFEGIIPGNLERECIEEVCNYEEAREIFKDDKKTQIFWAMYKQNATSSQAPRVDASALAAGIVATVVSLFIAIVVGCYCYKSRQKTRRGGSIPVRMSGELGTEESLGLNTFHDIPGSSAPGLPSYEDALEHTGQHDAPPPPYEGQINPGQRE